MQHYLESVPMPRPLTCSSCHYWQEIALATLPTNEHTGRCGRFSELRLGSARPRCNICWEPAVVDAPTEAAVATDD